MKKVAISLVTALALFFVSSCKKDSVEVYDCTGLTPTYTTDIKTILDANCAVSGCHNTSSRADGKDYSTYSSASSLSRESNFLGSIQHKSGYDAMPRGASKLSDATIKLISCWVQNGSPQ